MAAARPIAIPGLTTLTSQMWEWTLTTADPTGDPVNFADYADRTVQFVGASWGGATAALEGSLFPSASFLPLTNQSAVAISTTADDISTVGEATLAIRPNLTTVGVGAVVTVRLLARK